MNRVYLPLVLDVTNKEILLLGGGLAASEKLRTLSQLNKKIKAISRSFREEFYGLEWLTLIQREYREGDLPVNGIVYCGMNNPSEHDKVLNEAKQKNSLVNFIDKPDNSDFISASSLLKKNFGIFVTTYGRGPGVTKKIRQEIETALDLDSLDSFAEKFIEERMRKKNESKL
ncbi:MAG: NAD(P)-dependent oxidoreductase [Leptospiraceae bacterium]|nr:NAD(P)-dependent oxidoreductase [Leptospiraceae bacterium]